MVVSGTNKMPSSSQAAVGVALSNLGLKVHIQLVRLSEPKVVAPTVSAVVDYGANRTLVQDPSHNSDGVTGVQRPTSGNFYETAGISKKLGGAIGLISRPRGQAPSTCDASRVFTGDVREVARTIERINPGRLWELEN